MIDNIADIDKALVIKNNKRYSELCNKTVALEGKIYRKESELYCLRAELEALRVALDQLEGKIIQHMESAE